MNNGLIFNSLRVAFYIWIIAYFEVPWFMAIVLFVILFDALIVAVLFALGCRPIWVDNRTLVPILPSDKHLVGH